MQLHRELWRFSLNSAYFRPASRLLHGGGGGGIWALLLLLAVVGLEPPLLHFWLLPSLPLNSLWAREKIS